MVANDIELVVRGEKKSVQGRPRRDRKDARRSPHIDLGNVPTLKSCGFRQCAERRHKCGKDTDRSPYSPGTRAHGLTVTDFSPTRYQNFFLRGRFADKLAAAFSVPKDNGVPPAVDKGVRQWWSPGANKARFPNGCQRSMQVLPNPDLSEVCLTLKLSFLTF